MTTTGEKVLAALQPYGLKQERNGQWRCNTPWRAGSDSHGLVVKLSTDMEHGAFHEKVSGEFGSLYTLAEKLDIEVPRQQATETKRAYRDMADYAKAHGVGAEVFVAAGWKECRAKDTNGKERPALSIPTANGLRYRFLDGDKPSYHSPGGYKNCWYGLPRAVKKAHETGQPLVLCNGSPSVVVAQHYGLAAAALAGGGQRIPTELLEELRKAWQGEIILAMDCDNEGRTATQNYHEQIPTAQIVDLGLTLKGDLADFCMLHTDTSVTALTGRAVKFEAYQEQHDIGDLAKVLKELATARKAGASGSEKALSELVDRAQTEIDALREKAQPLELLSFGELVDANQKRLNERRKHPNAIQGLHTHLPKLDKIVGGWQDGRGYLIYGDTNMGKSTLAVSIAREWLKQGAGLVVPTENNAADMLDKFAACMARVPFDHIQTGQVDDKEYSAIEQAYTELETLNCHILNAGSPTPQMIGAALKRGIREYGYKWCLIDSISKMKYPGENDIYNTMRLVADGIQDLWRETNVPFLITCQVGRNLKDRAIKKPLPNDALGAGTIEQNADYILSLYRHDHYVSLGVCDPDENFPDNGALVTCIKDRWGGKVGWSVMLAFVGGAGFYEAELRKVDLSALGGYSSNGYEHEPI